MLRMISFVACLALATEAVGAQELALSQRGPRFLVAAGVGRVVEIEPATAPVFQRRVTLALERATIGEALAAVGRQAGIRMVYSRDVLDPDAPTRIKVEGITVAAALTEILLGAGVDVVLSDFNRVTLAPRRLPARPPAGAIVGRVTDADTQQGVVGADVFLEGTRWRTVTDENGNYRLADVAAGSYTATTRRIGYSRQSHAVAVLDGQEARVDFALATAPSILNEVIVAGTVVETRRRESPVPVATLSEEQIRIPARTRIDQLFRGDTPGIIGLEGAPSQSGAYMFVRGRASLDVQNLVKVYVDGVELPSTALISSVDLHNVERIELLRGPQASTIYGSNASGGVLLIFTKNGARGGPRLSGSAAAGTFASDFIGDDPLTMDHRLNLSGGGEGFTYSMGGSYYSAGEYIDQGDSRQVGLNGRARFTQGPFQFSLTSTYSNRVLGLANAPGAAVLEPILPELVLPVNTDITTNNQLLGASATYAPHERWETTLTVGWNEITDRGRQYAPQRATPADTTYNSWLGSDDQRSARLTSTLRLQAASGVTSTTTAGAEFSRSSHEFFDVDLYNPDAEFQEPAGTPFVTPRQVSNNQGYFLQEVLGFGDRLFLTGALRVERNSNFGANRDAVWAPRVGAAYLLDLGSRATIKPRASFGKSLRPPQPGQAGALVSPLYVQRANPNLRPEVQRGFDAGFDLDVGGGTLAMEATYFNQIAEDLIDLTIFSFANPGAGTPNIFQYQNIGEVANRGVELGLRSALGPVDLRASYTYTESEVKSLSDDYLGELQVGDQLIYVPRHTAGGTLGLNLGRRAGRGTRLELGVTYIGSRRTEDQISLLACLFGLESCVDDTPSFRDYWVRLPGFVKLRAGIVQPVRETVDVFVNVDNISNRQRGEFFAFYPSRGRSVLLGVRFGQ